MSDCCNHHHHGHHHHEDVHEHRHEDAPQLRPVPAGTTEETFRVRGMDCSEEIAAIERALKPIAGVLGIRANLLASSVTVYHDGSAQAATLIEAINKSGVTVQKAGSPVRKIQVLTAEWLVGISGLSAGAGMALDWLGFKATLWPDVAFLVAILAGGVLVLPKTLRALRTFSLDMNVLMTMAVLGAVAIGQHAEGAAVAFLFSLSELLESWSVGRARRAIKALMQLAPDNALVKKDDKFQEIPAEEVAIGETILVKAGQKFPLDGTVLAGFSTVDQAPITGESLPVEKKTGDAVYAGTINGEGSLEVRTTTAAGDTALSRTVRLVEEAQQQRAPIQRFVDVFAKYYTPAVVVLAMITGLAPPLLLGAAGMDWIYRALVLLVIACPCALVISTPVSIVSGLTAMARRGVLIKGGVYLEALGGLRALAIDKTGTITVGKPHVLGVLPFDHAENAEIVRIAAAIDTHSTHPFARAVVGYAQNIGVTIDPVQNYIAKIGRGAEAIIAGHTYFVGNHRFAHELGVCSEKLESVLADIEGEAKSVVIVGHRPHADCAGEVLGVLTIGDTIRANTAEAVRLIYAAGVRKVVMVSGDNSRTVNAIARQAGIDEAYGDLLPENKIERVRKLAAQFGHVGMIGDGVNDAPALAAAHVGIAMGSAGTDTAIETADVALMRDDLVMVSKAIRLGRRVLATIHFNIAFALGTKTIFFILALLGYTTLWLAVLADTGATLLVVANGLRLLREQASPPQKIRSHDFGQSLKRFVA
jgi:Zn2+/Cd2+-exporting ATPase